MEGGRGALTLLAGFVLSFSKILSDCCLVARPLMVTVILGDVVCWYRRRRTARGREKMSTVWSWSWSLKHVVVAPHSGESGPPFSDCHPGFNQGALDLLWLSAIRRTQPRPSATAELPARQRKFARHQAPLPQAPLPTTTTTNTTMSTPSEPP